MTNVDEQELLQLTRENNVLLKAILHFVHHDESNDFVTNVVANLLSNRIDGGGMYGRQNRIN